MKRKTTVLERLAREEISRNIKYYMTLNKKITLQQLAELTGIPKSTLGNYTRKANSPTPEAVEKIARALEVDPEDIDPRLVNIEEAKQVVQNSQKLFDLEKENFRTNLKFLMKEKKITEREIAKMTGYTIGAISHWLTGLTTPPAEAATNISKALNIPVSTLLSKHSENLKMTILDAIPDDITEEDAKKIILFIKDKKYL
ncbi:helix-turn-helix domain-containing protein [Lactobacillus jensenii]|uniref:helix-turn-helix domain-containing protein n=1 Tax=Lactobacillus jensenii TaxID=109790 RepID=UPI00118EB6E3|nr:helix-turn-helix transcriptional regulator [Lactobacillus jensenii]MDK7309056.1 helix-turn-helix transcriptional regulator [Lactobacillus jensenii]TVV21862.1 helix-turn-helix transcriptional regulator [Lactobacillus jensenii]